MKTNMQLKKLITELKKRSIEQGSPLWKRIATDLEKSTRRQRVVNVSKLAKYTKENETIIVPGKVLGTGDIGHKLNVAAFAFSRSAFDKISKNGKCMSLLELSENSPKDKRIRIIG